VINLQVQNKGLLLKFLDKFYRRCDIPWVQVVWAKYYEDRVPMLERLVAHFGGATSWGLSIFSEEYLDVK
jgi:hypothetical protein